MRDLNDLNNYNTYVSVLVDAKPGDQDSRSSYSGAEVDGQEFQLRSSHNADVLGVSDGD